MELESEICVVGGGPAGAVAANRLARLGYDVSLIERFAFPRGPTMESLAPVVLSLLEQVGLRDQIVGAGFPRPPHVVLWAGSRHVTGEDGSGSFVVDRGRFDQILLAGAGRAGVRIIQPAAAGRPVHLPDGGWLVPVMKSGVRINLKARFLIDCSGRTRLLAGRRARIQVPTLALSGIWHSAAAGPSTTWTESGPRLWYWGAPRPDGTFDATVFVDPYVKTRRGWAGIQTRYARLINQSSLGRGFLSNANLVELRARSANMYCGSDPVGHDFIKVGESVLAVDPLSAQGVTLAMASALRAAVVVNTLSISGPFSADASAAREFYRQAHFDAATRHRRLTAAEYGREAAIRKTRFWRSRAIGEPSVPTPRLSVDGPAPLNCRLALAADATVGSVPCVSGDVVKSMRALFHPALDRPVAYFGGAELAPLLDAAIDAPNMELLLRSWAGRFPTGLCRPFADWLWQRGVLKAVS